MVRGPCNDSGRSSVWCSEGRTRRTGSELGVGRRLGRAARGAVALVVGAVVGIGQAVVTSGPAHADTGGAGSRVMLLGDSILEQSADAAVAALAGHGVRTTVDARGGTGLLNGFDWMAHAAELVAAERPDVIVAVFSGNYFPPHVLGADGAEIFHGTPAFFAAWEAAADRFMAAVTATGAQVLWIKAPPMRAPYVSASNDGVWAAYQRMALRWPQAHLLDAGAVLAGPDGRFALDVPACDGGRVAVRDDDGVHLAPAGGVRLGGAIAAGVLDLLGGHPVSPPRTTGVAAITPVGGGYRVTSCAGEIADLGVAPLAVPWGNVAGGAPVVGAATTQSGDGEWIVDARGRVRTAGDARHHGDLVGTRLQRPVVGMAAMPTGDGYWLVAADGGIFTFGDAPFLGSTGDLRLRAPIVGMAPTPSGRGYWLVAADGGIFAFGDAPFLGSTGGLALHSPVVGMAATPSGLGYRLVAADGGIFAFGDAPFLGSAGGMRLRAPVVGMAPSPDGGYWLVARDGGVFTFGPAPFHGASA
jgi:hypothetical protein